MKIGGPTQQRNDSKQIDVVLSSLLGGIKTKPIDKETHFPESTFDIN